HGGRLYPLTEIKDPWSYKTDYGMCMESVFHKWLTVPGEANPLLYFEQRLVKGYTSAKGNEEPVTKRECHYALYRVTFTSTKKEKNLQSVDAGTITTYGKSLPALKDFPRNVIKHVDACTFIPKK
ncbi:hypothetical protein KJ865_04175, partial [Myxococcota bacterium]|nr:hypothetical protein [Myxococcota bacterium]